MFKQVFIKHNSKHKMWPGQKKKQFVEQGNLTIKLRVQCWMVQLKGHGYPCISNSNKVTKQ